MNQQLEEFYTHLNEAVVTTNDFDEGTKYRKREKVDQFAYCGLNKMYRSYLSFDLDLDDDIDLNSPGAVEFGPAFRFEEVNLPPPTIITINPANAHCHMLYRLVTPVTYTKNARSAPQDYFEAIQDEMEIRLRADRAYNHTLTKNPLHPRWRTITRPTSYDDTLVVTKLDRLGRNTTDVLGTIEKLAEMGVHVYCLALKGVALISASGRLHMTVLAAVAQFERDLLIERTHAGLAQAKAEGKQLGRRDALTPEQKVAIRTKLATGATARGLAKEYAVSHPTILKAAQST